jgi:hypothetical protein
MQSLLPQVQVKRSGPSLHHHIRLAAALAVDRPSMDRPSAMRGNSSTSTAPTPRGRRGTQMSDSGSKGPSRQHSRTQLASGQQPRRKSEHSGAGMQLALSAPLPSALAAIGERTSDFKPNSEDGSEELPEAPWWRRLLNFARVVPSPGNLNSSMRSPTADLRRDPAAAVWSEGISGWDDERADEVSEPNAISIALAANSADCVSHLLDAVLSEKVTPGSYNAITQVCSAPACLLYVF